MTTRLEKDLKLLERAVIAARKKSRYLLVGMPRKAKSVGQRRLQDLYGTPREFTQGCVDAIGDISVLEAMTAVRKYREEWDKA